MSLDWIAGIAGAIMALVFALFPALKTRYQELNGAGKRIVMILATLVVANCPE